MALSLRRSHRERLRLNPIISSQLEGSHVVQNSEHGIVTFLSFLRWTSCFSGHVYQIYHSLNLLSYVQTEQTYSTDQSIMGETMVDYPFNLPQMYLKYISNALDVQHVFQQDNP